MKLFGLLTCCLLCAMFLSNTQAQGATLLAPARSCKGQLNSQAVPNRQKQAMLCLINYARTKQGLSALVSSEMLQQSSQAKAKDMVSCREFSHSACGRDFLTWIQAAGYIPEVGAWGAGENLAWAGGSTYNSAENPRSIMRGWLHSPEHLDNILNPQWQEEGLGLLLHSFQGQPKAVVWVSQFGFRGQPKS